jgi:hypothetical protein
MSAQPSWYATQPAWYDESTANPGRDDEGDDPGVGFDDAVEYDDEDDDDQLD